MRSMRTQLTGRSTVTMLAALALGACATAPRGEANRIADAGIRATGTFQTDTGALAERLAAGGVTEAFVQRWQLCSNAPVACGERLRADPNSAARAKLADTVALRARAIGALGEAYGALKAEAEYDARDDLKSATNDAVGAVNAFAGAAFAGGVAPLPAPIAALVGEAAGIFADSRQRSRILTANAKLRELTQRFHDALEQEAFVFDSIAAIEEMRRTEARVALFEAGLIAGSDVIRPIADGLGTPLAGDANQRIANSQALRLAVGDVARAQSQVETARIQARYRGALAALRALVAEHDRLGQGGGVSLAEIDRLLGTINASLSQESPEPPAPTEGD